VVHAFRYAAAFSPVLPAEVLIAVLRRCEAVTEPLARAPSSSGARAMGHDGANGELDFRQGSFHHIRQVLRGCAFCAFSAPPAFPPCSCSRAFRHQGRRLTSRISSESSPGSQECVANCHGAARQSYARQIVEPATERPYRRHWLLHSPTLPPGHTGLTADRVCRRQSSDAWRGLCGPSAGPEFEEPRHTSASAR
jgi:hypothetical protein